MKMKKMKKLKVKVTEEEELEDEHLCPSPVELRGQLWGAAGQGRRPILV